MSSDLACTRRPSREIAIIEKYYPFTRIYGMWGHEVRDAALSAVWSRRASLADRIGLETGLFLEATGVQDSNLSFGTKSKWDDVKAPSTFL